MFKRRSTTVLEAYLKDTKSLNAAIKPALHILHGVHTNHLFVLPWDFTFSLGIDLLPQKFWSLDQNKKEHDLITSDAKSTSSYVDPTMSYLETQLQLQILLALAAGREE